MSFKLLALDLDGTTLVDGYPPTGGVLQAVRAAQDRNVQVVLATGRPYASVLHFAPIFGLSTPAICYQGALVKEIGGRERTLLAQEMPREPLIDYLRLSDERGYDTLLYSESQIFVSAACHRHELDFRWFGMEVEHVPSLLDGLARIDAAGLAPLKTLLNGEPEESDRRVVELSALFGDRISVVRSHPRFVETCCQCASKGRALAHVAEHLGVAQDEVIAVGDSGNDLSMIQWAGLGVAMGNATADVKAVANWVAPSVEDDGVAAVIERFVLRNGRS